MSENLSQKRQHKSSCGEEDPSRKRKHLHNENQNLFPYVPNITQISHHTAGKKTRRKLSNSQVL
jgi:hypothetical protein